MADERILIVEDDANVAAYLRHALTGMGYRVSETVTFGKAALAQIAACAEGDQGKMPPDIVLMDAQLAGEMDGIETAAQIRDRYSIPVVYLAGHMDKETLQRAKITEPFGYVSTPVREQDLYTTIEMALYRHELETRLRKSEDRFALFMQHLPAAVFIKDGSGRFVYANERFAEVIGHQVSEVVGHASQEFTPPALIPQYDRENRMILSEGQTVVSESVFPGPSSPTHWLTHKFPIYREGHPAYVGGVSIDITARKQAEEALGESEDHLRHFVEQMPYPVEVCSPDGTAVMVNQAFLEMFGVPSADLVIGRYNVFEDPTVMKVLGLA